MSEKFKFHDPEGLYFVTSTVVHGIGLFTRKGLKHTIIDSLKHCQGHKGLIIHAWCLMPSHLHMIISSKGEPWSNIMRDFKQFTTKQIIEEITLINESRSEWLLRAFEKAGKERKRISNNKVWQEGNQPKSIVTTAFPDQKLNYILSNPTEAEIVDEAAQDLYCSARDYAGSNG
jgi:putative transposase